MELATLAAPPAEVLATAERLSGIITKRSRWATTVSNVLLMNRSLAWISIITCDLPQAVKFAKEHAKLKRELREEAVLRVETQTALERVKKAAKRRAQVDPGRQV